MKHSITLYELPISYVHVLEKSFVITVRKLYYIHSNEFDIYRHRLKIQIFSVLHLLLNIDVSMVNLVYYGN